MWRPYRSAIHAQRDVSSVSGSLSYAETAQMLSDVDELHQ
jgi:hypothetical protein